MTKIYRMRLILAMTAAVLAAEPVAHAQQQSQSSPPAASASAAETPDARREREVGEALDAMKDAVKAGPVSIPLLDQGRIDVPEGYIFVPRAEAARFSTPRTVRR